MSHSRGRTFLDNPRERIPEKTEMEARDLMVVQAVFRRCQSKLWTLTRLLVCRRKGEVYEKIGFHIVFSRVFSIAARGATSR